MIPGRQIGRSRTVARAVAERAGIPPKVFDKLWDEYERGGCKMNDDISYLYVNPEVTEAFEEMDKEDE